MKPREQAFADYYIETLNAEQSAIRAGYSERYARGNAHKLVARSCIKSYIEERMKSKENDRIASQNEVLEYLTQVMRGQITEQVPVLGDAGIELVDAEARIKERNKAAELLGRRYMLWVDKQNVEHTGSVIFKGEDHLGD